MSSITKTNENSRRLFLKNRISVSLLLVLMICLQNYHPRIFFFLPNESREFCGGEEGIAGAEEGKFEALCNSHRSFLLSNRRGSVVAVFNSAAYGWSIELLPWWMYNSRALYHVKYRLILQPNHFYAFNVSCCAIGHVFYHIRLRRF